MVYRPIAFLAQICSCHRLTVAKSYPQLADLAVSCYLLQNSQIILTARQREGEGRGPPRLLPKSASGPRRERDVQQFAREETEARRRHVSRHRDRDYSPGLQQRSSSCKWSQQVPDVIMICRPPRGLCCIGADF